MKSRLADASSVVVLNPAKPAQIDISAAFDPTRFVPLYGLVYDIYTATALADIQKELQVRKFDAAILLQKELLSNLGAAGHVGRPHTIPRERASTQRKGPRSDPRPQRKSAGVYPDVVAVAELPSVDGHHLFLDSQLIIYGFWAGANGDFTPKLMVHARMTDTAAKQILMDRLFAYNLAEPKAVRLTGDAAERWSDLQSMKADVPGLERALSGGVSAVAAAIVKELQTPEPAAAESRASAK
ncbi:hypothetical protein HNQ60_005177 [Povalibacter uvarum]|uniref:Uncharacterized protein n=1 Tax=Povalibacter uvarum TaxID=732238 RepID=A0A841HWU5_9GAMM|nr:hypothetical protein [Povalibacter uvarum]MBB6096255.1 hypothetical protein [Povalibacter uvarum]